MTASLHIPGGLKNLAENTHRLDPLAFLGHFSLQPFEIDVFHGNDQRYGSIGKNVQDSASRSSDLLRLFPEYARRDENMNLFTQMGPAPGPVKLLEPILHGDPAIAQFLGFSGNTQHQTQDQQDDPALCEHNESL